MSGVESRTTLVTGAGRGIGRATALLLASRGANVLCVARTESELKSIGLPYFVADLGSETGCELAVRETEQQLGPIEVLVCNHGIGSAHERVVWEQDPQSWRETQNINLDGPFYLTRLVLQSMVAAGYGRLVYTSSTAGKFAEHAGSAYTASKHGLLGLMRSVALDAGPHGITANAVLPGWVRTEMAERSAISEAKARDISSEQVWAERDALYPAGRVPAASEVAELIAFLASEESSGVSGQAISVTLGGLY